LFLDAVTYGSLKTIRPAGSATTISAALKAQPTVPSVPAKRDTGRGPRSASCRRPAPTHSASLAISDYIAFS
jgi:hypothetical protein